ncbi:hypothetical protein, partial [Mesorhizobium sp. Root102]|uniref:hypothetical protein n=1 Tax=Mesorhizobium sp. Root102 TaxID=1736422 RepID=UPI001AECCC2D
SPLKKRRVRVKHGSILDGNILGCRVSSQWQSTMSRLDESEKIGARSSGSEQNCFRKLAIPSVDVCLVSGSAIVSACLTITDLVLFLDPFPGHERPGKCPSDEGAA